MGKLIINISGKSGSGKSTLTQSLFEKIEGIYIISYDKTKWLLSGYDRDKHTKIIKNTVFGLFKSVCEQGLPIIINGSISTEEEYLKYLEVAKNNGYSFTSFNLVVPKDVLLSRFRERVKKAKADGSKISVKDEDTFLKNHSIEYFTPPNSVVFDTSLISIEEISKQISSKLSGKMKFP